VPDLSHLQAEILERVLEDRAEFTPLSQAGADDMTVATALYRVALARIALQVADPVVRVAAAEALKNPSPWMLSRLRELSRGKPWEMMLLDGLSALAIAGSTQQLGGGNG